MNPAEVKIYRAIMELVDAKPKYLNAVSRILWDEAKTKTQKRNEKRFIRASDIAALVRDRNKRK